MPPKAAVVARAGMYLGASLFKKIFDETKPIRLLNGTPTLLITTLRPSCGILLLYHVLNKTLGAAVPQHIIKVAK